MTSYIIELIFYYFMWLLWAYWIHRLSHIKSKKNPLYKIHLEHHKIKYGHSIEVKLNFSNWRYLFLWFGNLKSSLDVWITLTFPVLALSIIEPKFGIPLLIYNYIYEVFFSEEILDHNPNISGYITNFFACGQYHLEHHRYPNSNYSLYITLWDYVFSTVYIKNNHNNIEIFSYLSSDR